jgi:hypothetical protein
MQACSNGIVQSAIRFSSAPLPTIGIGKGTAGALAMQHHFLSGDNGLEQCRDPGPENTPV